MTLKKAKIVWKAWQKHCKSGRFPHYPMNYSREDVVEAFRTIWKSNLSEREFHDLLEYTIAMPETLYIMVKERV